MAISVSTDIPINPNPTDSSRISFGKLLAWSSSHASQAANVLFLSYFTLYCTDTLALNAAVVGTLLLVSKIIDAAGVLFAGWLVDVSPETRWGKARPYDLAVVGIWALTAVLYATPGTLGTTAKYVWVFATYLLITAVFTPLFGANQPLYMARVFGNRDAYTKVAARSGLIIGVVTIGVAMSFPKLVENAGKSPDSWARMGILIAIPMALFGILRFAFIRETRDTEAPGLPRVSFRDVRTVLSTNPYLWAVAGVQLVVAIVGNFSANSYYYRYVVGDLSLMGTLAILNMLLLPMLVVMPALVRRFSVSLLISTCCVLGSVGYLVFSVAGAHIPLLVLATLLANLGAMPISFLLPVLIIDNATYNEWRGNRRLESVGGGVTSFAMQLGAGLSAAIAGAILSSTGYDGSLDVQPDSAITGIIALVSWVPAGLSLVSACLAVGYHRFERRIPTITAELAERRAQLSEIDPPAHP